MSAVRLIVREWEPLNLPRDLDSPRLRERIVKIGSRPSGDAFSLRRGRIYARDRVGLVDAGRVQVQIVPKIHESSTVHQDEAALLALFLRCGIPVSAQTLVGNTSSGKGLLTEALIRRFAQDTFDALLVGGPRRYARRSGLSQTLRGRVSFARRARQRPGTEHLVPITHFTLQQDNELGRLIKALIRYLLTRTQSVRSRELLGISERLLDAVASVPFTRELVNSVHLTRLEKHWSRPVELARLLSRGSTPNPTEPGDIAGFTMIFSLEGLFEKVLRKAFLRGLRGADYLLHRHSTIGQLLQKNGGARLLPMRPDFAFARRDSPDEVLLVGDAKWKRLQPDHRNLGIRPADVYQVLAYMMNLDIQIGMLCYPARNPLSPATPFETFELEIRPELGRLLIVEIDIEPLLSRDVEVRDRAEMEIGNYVLELIYSSRTA